MREFGQWRYSVDRAATEAAYAREPAGGAPPAMRWLPQFRRGRSQIFPPRFVEFLESLGIDAAKEAEAYHTARLARAGIIMAVVPLYRDSRNYR